jgi:Tol biopolymer transport system component
MRISPAPFILAAALCAGAALAGQAAAAFPGSNGRIGYTRVSNGRTDIYTMRADGSHKRRVARDAGEPAFSPNGEKIVFTRDRHSAGCQCFKGDIYIMRANGSHQRPLIHTSAAEVAPSFSPSGKRVVFASIGSGRNGIYTTRVDGSRVRKVVAGRFTRDPQFSPGGRQIVFERSCAITIMRADGSNEHALTTPLDEACDAVPDFSPNGEMIAFAEEDEVIYVMGTDGTDLTPLGPPFPANNNNPAFSPDGHRIAFDSNREGPPGENEIYTMRTDGSNVNRLTFGKHARAVQPSWAPRRPS